MRKTEIVQAEKVVYICDQCEREARVVRCEGCLRDVCANCYKTLYRHPFTEEDYNDYGVNICAPCVSVLAPYKQQAAAIHRAREAAIEALQERWKQQCKQDREAAVIAQKNKEIESQAFREIISLAKHLS